MGRGLGAEDGQPGKAAGAQRGAAEAQMFYVREHVQTRVMARSCCHRSDDGGNRHWARRWVTLVFESVGEMGL